MAGTFTGGSGDERRPSTYLLLLDALDDALAAAGQSSARTKGLMGLCRMLARLVDATAAAHVRYDPHVHTTQLALWRPDHFPAALSVEEPEARPSKPHDWWPRSAARRVLLDSLDQRYLAELPLDWTRRRPTMLVVGRGHPFTDSDSERMAAAHRSLSVVEKVIDGLRARSPAAIVPPAEHVACTPAVDLTARELEVLEMLGEGLLARSIAQRLDVSERTVHKHLGNLYRKLDAHDRLLAVRRAEVLGLLPVPEPVGW